MSVFEPTLTFDASFGGHIFIDLRVRAHFRIHGRYLGFNETPRAIKLPLNVRARVFIRRAAIPVDVFYDKRIAGVRIRPKRREGEFFVSHSTVQIHEVAFLKLPKFLRNLSGKLIGQYVDESLSAAMVQAIPSYYFLLPNEKIDSEVAQLFVRFGLNVAKDAQPNR